MKKEKIMLMKKKRIGKRYAFYRFSLIALLSIFAIFATSCKDDDEGMKVPCMNHSDNKYYLSNTPEMVDSLYEMNEQSYHLWSLSIYNKETHESIGDVFFSSQNENDILDAKGNKLGEVKYGKNDVMEININNFCTFKRKIDSQKGKMYIITPTQNKRNDICVYINIMLDKGGPTTVTIQ